MLDTILKLFWKNTERMDNKRIETLTMPRGVSESNSHQYINDGNVYPAVGLSFGLEPIYTILKEKLDDLEKDEIYIIPMDTEIECLNLADKLRRNNLNVLVELNKRKIKKCFEYANKENIKYVIVVGSNEIENNCYTLKDMKTGEQYNMNEIELLEFLK